MKELSIRQKAARYDEALAWMRDLYPTMEGAMKEDAEHYFPALKESEDERIRKWIKNELESKYVVDNIVNNVMADKALAWLERQCENGINGNEREIPFSEQILANSAKTCKDEHKPAENKGMNLVEEEMTPFQKKVFCIIDTTVEEEHGLKQVCDELFALASNEIKQKPAWSEEDEVKINRIVACLENLNVADNDILLKDVDWLKSLKDRYTWKPSDEQIMYMGEAIDIAEEASKYSVVTALKEIREQLKKLKD